MKNSQSGFSLLESMVAVLLTATLAYTVAQVQTQAERHHITSISSDDCNALAESILDGVATVGRALKYDTANNKNSGAYEMDSSTPPVLKAITTTNMVKDDIVTLVNDNTCISSNFKALSAGCPDLKLDFDVGTTTSGNLGDLMVFKLERKPWNIDENTEHKESDHSDPKCDNDDITDTASESNKCAPRPISLCKEPDNNPDRNECETEFALDANKAIVSKKVYGRPDLGHKLQLTLRTCKNLPGMTTTKCAGTKDQNEIERECVAERLLQYKADLNPVKFKEGAEIEFSGSFSNSDPVEEEIKKNLPLYKFVASYGGNVANPPDEKIDLEGRSILHYGNRNEKNASNQCGTDTHYNTDPPMASEVTLEFNSKFHIETNSEMEGSLILCRLQYKEFQRGATKATQIHLGKQLNGWLALDASGLNAWTTIDWVPCVELLDSGGTRKGAIKKGSVTVNGKDSFSIDIEYYYKLSGTTPTNYIDADHRLSVMVVDPAGNSSKIKAFDFGSKNCEKYMDLGDHKLRCPPNYFCIRHVHNPWLLVTPINEQNEPDDEDRSEHRRNSECIYYKVLNNHKDPPLRYLSHNEFEDNTIDKTSCRVSGTDHSFYDCSGCQRGECCSVLKDDGNACDPCTSANRFVADFQTCSWNKQAVHGGDEMCSDRFTCTYNRGYSDCSKSNHLIQGHFLNDCFEPDGCKDIYYPDGPTGTAVHCNLCSVESRTQTTCGGCESTQYDYIEQEFVECVDTSLNEGDAGCKQHGEKKWRDVTKYALPVEKGNSCNEPPVGTGASDFNWHCHNY